MNPMKRKIIAGFLILGLLGLAGCAKTEQTVKPLEVTPIQAVTEPAQPPQGEEEDAGENAPLDAVFALDDPQQIRAKIDEAAASAACLQAELEGVETICKKAQNQAEMNTVSEGLSAIWDAEVESLWGRVREAADGQAWESLCAQQENWAAMREEAVLEFAGSGGENGSADPQIANAFRQQIARDRAYVLANALAQIRGESFVLPEKSENYGFFVDDQGTGSIYSALVLRPGTAGDGEAAISLYRLAEIEGTFADNGNGELPFTSQNVDGVKGTIEIHGWEGAAFTVTEAPEGYAVRAGETFDFPFAF